ncbi:MAG: type II secretion system protein [Candidatus Omnitrophica bacterium]|nr:type II secretion system protein [Candidatus Omnitrophota bacterium]
MLNFKNRRSLTLIELLVVLCLIFIITGIFATYLNITLRIARETALQMELSNIRLAVEHYYLVNDKFPDNLTALSNQEFTFKDLNGIIFHNKFLESIRLDKQGELADPFSNKYYYDSQEGRVRSQTKGYENW